MYSGLSDLEQCTLGEKSSINLTADVKHNSDHEKLEVLKCRENTGHTGRGFWSKTVREKKILKQLPHSGLEKFRH